MIRLNLFICSLLASFLAAAQPTDSTLVQPLTDSVPAGLLHIDSIRLETAPPDSVLATAPASLKAPDSITYYRLNGTYLKSYWTSFKQVAARPAHWKGRNFAQLGFFVAGTGLLMTADYDIRKRIQGNRTKTMDDVAQFFYPVGNLYPSFILGGLYLTGLATHDRKMENASLMATKSLLISTGFYIAIKGVLRRGRPDYAHSPFTLARPFTKNIHYTSSPSGHAVSVFSVATALANEYRETKWVPIFAYSVATLTGLSRLVQNRHWASDVFVGACVGHFITQAIYTTSHRKKKEVKADF